MSRTGRGRGRARAEIAVARVLEKRLGALPVVAEFGRRLRIAEIVDELCPVRPVAWISHGEVIEALVANRLTAPAPMVRVQEWAAAMAVDEAYGIAPPGPVLMQQITHVPRRSERQDAGPDQVGQAGALVVVQQRVQLAQRRGDRRAPVACAGVHRP